MTGWDTVPEDVDAEMAGAREIIVSAPVNGRDFTAVVDMAPSASRSAAGISLAGTTGAESKALRSNRSTVAAWAAGAASETTAAAATSAEAMRILLVVVSPRRKRVRIQWSRRSATALERCLRTN